MLTDKKALGWSGAFFLLVIVATLLTQLTVAQGQAQSASEAVYTFTGGAIEGPETLEAGYHTFTLHNNGDKDADIVIVQLNQAGAEKDFVKEVQAVDKAFSEERSDPAAAFRAVLEGRTLWGGPAAYLGESESVGVNLPSGRYLLLASAFSENEPTSNIVKPLEVTGEAADAPKVDATVQLVDFAFALPNDLEPGEQTWKFINNGEQVHHTVIQKLKEGKTMADMMKYAETYEGEDPTVEFGHVNMLSPGSSNFVTLNFIPGTYVALCFIPDYAPGGDGAPHMAHGMMQAFTVAGE